MDIVGHVRRVAKHFGERIRSYVDHPLIGECRQVGLLGALEIVADKETGEPFEAKRGVGAHLAARAQEKGLISRAMGDSLAFAPPLIIEPDEIDEMFDLVDKSLIDTQAWTKAW